MTTDLNDLVRFRLAKTEKELLQALADKNRMTISAYLRWLILQHEADLKK